MTVQQPTQTLMFAYDYYPGRSLQVVARLQQSVTRQILGQEAGDDGDPVVSDTSEWNVYLANYESEQGPGEYVLLLTRGGQLQQDSQPQLGTSATFFNDQLNLLEVTVEGGDGDGTPEDETPTPEEDTPEDGTPEDDTPTPEDDTPTPEDETPTPEEETPTPEDGTPTPEDGTPTPDEPAGNGGNGGNGGAGGDGGANGGAGG